MMRERCAGNFSRDIYFWQVYKVIASEAYLFLYKVFRWGCDKDPTITLRDYLVSEKGMSNRDYKKRFDSTMRAKIDANPLGNDFDVSLLYAAIKTACEDLEDEESQVWNSQNFDKLECICTEIKNIRCDLIHEGKVSDENERDELIDKIKDLLCRGFVLAGEKYHQCLTDIDICIKEMKDAVKSICSARVMPLNVEQYKEEITELQNYHQSIVQEEVCELKETYMNLNCVDPTSWLSGKDSLKLKAVFTSVEVVKERMDLMNPEAINYENLLATEAENNKIPNVVVIEGEAGAGKSTLCRLLMEEWAQSNITPPNFKGLVEFDIVFLFECRNQNISRFEDLVSWFFPKSSCHAKIKDLVRTVLRFKVLVIADGLDEGTTSSECLLKEIISTTIPRCRNNLHLVLTTRPERIKKLSVLCEGECWLHTRIKGISLHKRSEFVHRLHSEMVNCKLSKQDTQGLIDFLKQSQMRIGEHYRLPLILTLLTYLWAYNPGCVNAVTTSTSLYMAFHTMVLKRLLDRLVLHISNQSHEDLEKMCGDFLKVLYEVSSVTLSSDSLRITGECSDKLNEVCRKISLPSEELLAAFLTVDRKWTSEGYKTYLVAPHKSIMEFYAAQFLFQRIFLHNDDEDFDKELRELCLKHNKTLDELKALLDISQTRREKETLQETVENIFMTNDKPDCFLSDFQNVFIHFGGIVADKEPHALEDMALEFVELLQEAKINGSRWLDVITEIKCNDAITRLVARNVKMHLIIRDGHTIAAQEVMKYLDERIPIRVVLECDALHIPHLEVMLNKIAARDCDVELFLNHQWRDSDFDFSDDLLVSLVGKKCRLSHFAGNLCNLKLLPVTIKKLRCTIPDNEHAEGICKALEILHSQLDLEYLGVHVVAGIQPENLRKLPICKWVSKECATLWLSKVTNRDVEWASSVARALLPNECKFGGIYFPKSDLSTTKCRELVSALYNERILIKEKGGIKVTSSTMTPDEERDLRYFTREHLKCSFHNVCESEIW